MKQKFTGRTASKDVNDSMENSSVPEPAGRQDVPPADPNSNEMSPVQPVNPNQVAIKVEAVIQPPSRPPLPQVNIFI